MRLKTIFAIAIGTIATLSHGLGLRAESDIELEERELLTTTYITPIYKGLPVPISSPLYLKCKTACPVNTPKRELTEDNINTFEFFKTDFERELATTDEVGQQSANYTGTPEQNFDLMNAIYKGQYIISSAKTKGAALFQMLGSVEFSCSTVVNLGNFLLKLSTNFPNAMKLLQPTISKGKTTFASCFPVPPSNTTIVDTPPTTPTV